MRHLFLVVADLSNLGLGIESLAPCVVATPFSSTLTTLWWFAAYETCASWAKACCESLAAEFIIAAAGFVRAWNEAASFANLSTSLLARQSAAVIRKPFESFICPTLARLQCAGCQTSLPLLTSVETSSSRISAMSTHILPSTFAGLVALAFPEAAVVRSERQSVRMFGVKPFKDNTVKSA